MIRLAIFLTVLCLGSLAVHNLVAGRSPDPRPSVAYQSKKERKKIDRSASRAQRKVRDSAPRGGCRGRGTHLSCRGGSARSGCSVSLHGLTALPSARCRR